MSYTPGRRPWAIAGSVSVVMIVLGFGFGGVAGGVWWIVAALCITMARRLARAMRDDDA
jgi:hypothetical protein